MPSCVVKSCRNQTGLIKKSQGITFHRFPKGNDVWRNDWIQIIRESRNENHWNPSKSSVICNTHFDPNDFYTTKGGLLRLVTFAVPQKLLNESPMAQEPKEDNSFNQTSKVSCEPVINIKNKLKVENIASAAQESSSVTRGVIIDCGQVLPFGSCLPSNATVSLPQISYEALPVQEKQPTEAYIPRATQRISARPATAFHTAQPLSDLNKQKMKIFNLEKMQNKVENQKTKIKMLHQKVRRLQKRNKSLKMIVKKVINKSASGPTTSKAKKVRRKQRDDMPEGTPACVECGFEMTSCELYRCVQCPLVVMCAKCARVNAHVHHCVMRIPSLLVYNKIDSIFGLLRELTNKLSKEDNDQTGDDENDDDSEGNVPMAESPTSDQMDEDGDPRLHQVSPAVHGSINQENSSSDEDDKSQVFTAASQYEIPIEPTIPIAPSNETVTTELKAEKRKATQTPEKTKMKKYHDSGAIEERGTGAPIIKKEVSEVIEIKIEKLDDNDQLVTNNKMLYQYNDDFSNR